MAAFLWSLAVIVWRGNNALIGETKVIITPSIPKISLRLAQTGRKCNLEYIVYPTFLQLPRATGRGRRLWRGIIWNDAETQDWAKSGSGKGEAASPQTGKGPSWSWLHSCVCCTVLEAYMHMEGSFWRAKTKETRVFHPINPHREDLDFSKTAFSLYQHPKSLCKINQLHNIYFQYMCFSIITFNEWPLNSSICFFCVCVSFSTFFCHNTGEPQRFSTSDLESSLSDFSTQFSPQVKKKKNKCHFPSWRPLKRCRRAPKTTRETSGTTILQIWAHIHTEKKKSSHNQKSVNRPDGSICCVPRFLFNQPVLCGSSRCCESC